MTDLPLGRIESSDLSHLAAWSLDVPMAPSAVEVLLPLPQWALGISQGQHSSCVGYGCSMLMTAENNRTSAGEGDHRYHPEWLWNAAKKQNGQNPSADTGTTVHAAAQVLKAQGHVRIVNGVDQPPNLHEGIAAYRWIGPTSGGVDGVRACLAMGVPMAIGVNWYHGFDTPVKGTNPGEYWIGTGQLGAIRGGHCVTIVGASDSKRGGTGAVLIKNSWGAQWPASWMPYSVIDRLLKENGEFVAITDR